MKFRITKDEFLKMIESVYHAVPSRAALPILENIKLEAKGDELSLFSTNLNFSLKVKGSVEVEEEGALCVRGKELKEITSRLKNEKILIEKKEERELIIYTSQGQYSFFIQPAEEFPLVEEVTGKNEITISSDIILEGVEKVSFCVAKNDSRQFLNNILLDVKGKRLSIVSSDSHRLGVYDIEIENNGLEGNFLVDPKSFDFLKNYKKEQIKILFSDTKIQFNFSNGYEIVNLVDDKFPDYRAVIPVDVPNNLKISKQDLMETLRRLHIFTSPPNNPIQFSLSPDSLTVKAVSGEIGEGYEKLKGFYEGERIEIGFNCNYLLEILRHIDEDVVFIGITGSESACILRGESTSNYLYLLMPIRI
ncbi:MAG: DNA polymerase III subunit beta [Candidatus Hydrothermales bacterium]